MTDFSPPASPPEPAAESQPRPALQDDFFRSPSFLPGLARIGLYLILVNVITYVSLLLAGVVVRSGPSPFAPRSLVATELARLLGTFAAACVMSLLESRRFGAYGLPLRSAFGKLFWLGALFGLLEISAVVGAMAVLGAYHFGAIVLLSASQLLRWLVFWALFFVVVGLYEEFAYRGYLQFTLAQSTGFWSAALLLSGAFGAAHIFNPGETWTGILGIVLTGVLWCFTLQRTGSLWFAVGMHAGFDFGETFLYSVPDSGFVFPGHLSAATLAGPSWLTGGSAGPEGSVFDFLMLLLFFYIVHRLFPSRPASPQRNPCP